jgi:hypothetical protein
MSLQSSTTDARSLHACTLPDGVDPIPVPDTDREAEILIQLLDAGLYPKCAEPKELNGGKDSFGAKRH